MRCGVVRVRLVLLVRRVDSIPAATDPLSAATLLSVSLGCKTVGGHLGSVRSSWDGPSLGRGAGFGGFKHRPAHSTPLALLVFANRPPLILRMERAGTPPVVTRPLSVLAVSNMHAHAGVTNTGTTTSTCIGPVPRMRWFRLRPTPAGSIGLLATW